MTQQFAKIVDHPSLYRDLHTQAILQTDPVVLRKHEQRIKVLEKEQARDAELCFLRTQLMEVRALVLQLSANQVPKTC
jgi:hypothetical protein